MKIIYGIFIVLMGCASQEVPFQKLNNGIGYTVEQKSKNNLIIKANIPPSILTRTKTRYFARAVGEECLKLGFAYFDYTEPVDSASEGFCFPNNKRIAFAIKFKMDKLDSVPPEFIVEYLNQKAKTFLQINDKIIKINDIEPHSIAELKKYAFSLGEKNIQSVKIELLRNGKTLHIEEPMAVLSSGSYGPEDLQSLREN